MRETSWNSSKAIWMCWNFLTPCNTNQTRNILAPCLARTLCLGPCIARNSTPKLRILYFFGKKRSEMINCCVVLVQTRWDPWSNGQLDWSACFAPCQTKLDSVGFWSIPELGNTSGGEKTSEWNPLGLGAWLLPKANLDLRNPWRLPRYGKITLDEIPLDSNLDTCIHHIARYKWHASGLPHLDPCANTGLSFKSA